MPRDPERMAQAGLIDNRSGEMFFTQLAQLKRSDLVDVEMAQWRGVTHGGIYRE
jgi:hypothetical protein